MRLQNHDTVDGNEPCGECAYIIPSTSSGSSSCETGGESGGEADGEAGGPSYYPGSAGKEEVIESLRDWARKTKRYL